MQFEGFEIALEETGSSGYSEVAAVERSSGDSTIGSC